MKAPPRHLARRGRGAARAARVPAPNGQVSLTRTAGEGAGAAQRAQGRRRTGQQGGGGLRAGRRAPGAKCGAHGCAHRHELAGEASASPSGKQARGGGQRTNVGAKAAGGQSAVRRHVATYGAAQHTSGKGGAAGGAGGPGESGRAHGSVASGETAAAQHTGRRREARGGSPRRPPRGRVKEGGQEQQAREQYNSGSN